MKNNTLFLFLILLLLPSFAFSIGSYAAGDKLTVHAASGLILRETAAPAGTKIMTVEYGSLVTIQAEGLKKTAHSVTVFPGFTIKGFWVKVKTANGKTGFLFDGYLSKYKTPGSLPNDDDSDVGTIQERYLKMHSPAKGAKVNLPKGETRYDHYKVTYTNGAEVEADMGEGGSSYTIRFNPGMTMEEAYLIGKALWMEDAENIKSTIDKGKISLLSGDELYAMELFVKAGVVTLVMQHAD
jgi:Bacterial SH3 domain